MGFDDYSKACRLGKKDYQARMMRGEKPTLAVLDDIMPDSRYYEVPLGLVQVPIDRIVGTKTMGRSSSFAGNFMPILNDGSEFAAKWIRLSDSQKEEGIRDPIKAYEYMNYFYVEEGNKRVSVMKYFGAVSIPGKVTRIVPPRTDEKENKIYYEFMDFYQASSVNYIWFSQEGSFTKLQKVVGKKPGEEWTDDDRLKFSDLYTRFSSEYEARGGGKLSITKGDAFLAFITLYGYDEMDAKTTSELSKLIAKSWEEFELLQEEGDIDLKMKPSTEKKPLLSMLLPVSAPKMKAAFIYEKTPGTSAWTYAHELGRLYLEQTFPDEVSTVAYENGTEENVEGLIADAIRSGCNLIFTTTPPFVQASVKAAIANPEVRILNCSLNTSHRYIRTYYSRMHEAKFLMGAIAGAMAENNQLTYIADYPIFGSIANINAFALGAKMINPRAKVHLVWSSMKELDMEKVVRETSSTCISGRDMVIPEEASRFFGIYHVQGEHSRNLAMPLYHWGKFYEQLIRTIMDGTWKYDDNASTTKAINYWWGMSAGVIDVVCSRHLPIGTRRLVELLKKTIMSGEFNPFAGILYSQDGLVQKDPGRVMLPEEIMTMDWLAENVIGAIPKKEELKEQAEPVIKQQGVTKELN
ncbi:MAG: BMP family ABC transporter substrate-binding protein [Lachnospiraceae bacterium]|uniref:BMP family ABC transporter substrate-binding protein n=1 Tax=uncultured Acetatifactor sp. TaxID=1671927 RepID=UPI0026376DEA|nr:BMP family ABC transporter substrate-binding protein [uncultured Acetatifactor sp.]MCI8788477.1 BMP family ABC transporter substrate-binding protein [Lachnospiraceae bacterium]